MRKNKNNSHIADLSEELNVLPVTTHIEGVSEENNKIIMSGLGKHPNIDRHRLGGRPKGGRPHFHVVDTFDDAMTLVSPREAMFVRHVLAGKNRAEAYRLSAPGLVQDATARTGGHRTASTRGVRQALALGRQTGALAAITGLTYDATRAMEELLDAMAFAKKTQNATALARCIELRARLFKLLDLQGPLQAMQVNFSFGNYAPPVSVIATMAGEGDSDGTDHS